MSEVVAGCGATRGGGTGSRSRKQPAAGRSYAQLRHLSGEFAEHLVDRFRKLLRILFRITA
jgi:hypothetical protein